MLQSGTEETSIEGRWAAVGAGGEREDANDSPFPTSPQEQRLTFDRVLDSAAAQVGVLGGREEGEGSPQPGFYKGHGMGNVSLQEAEQELLAQVRPALGSVSRGYSVALLLRGREREAPRLVPQVSSRGVT